MIERSVLINCLLASKVNEMLLLHVIATFGACLSPLPYTAKPASLRVGITDSNTTSFLTIPTCWERSGISQLENLQFKRDLYLDNMHAKGGYIYILANRSRTVLYIGVTSNLYARTFDHKNGDGSTFTRKYNCTDLMYYESFTTIEEAIHREKQLKKWKRSFKDELIDSFNPKWKDLFDQVSEMQ